MGDDEWHLTMAEISTEKGGATMRDVFVTLLLHCEVNDPQALFDKHRDKMMEDIKRNLRMSNARLRLNELFSRSRRPLHSSPTLKNVCLSKTTRLKTSSTNGRVIWLPCVPTIGSFVKKRVTVGSKWKMKSWR